LFANSDLASPPMVIALKLGATSKEKVVGVAYADATLRKLGVCEILDTDLYSNLEVSPLLPPFLACSQTIFFVDVTRLSWFN